MEILPRSNQNLGIPPKSTDPWKSFPGPTKMFKMHQILQNPRIHRNPSQVQPKSSKFSKINGSMEILIRSDQNFHNPPNPSKSTDPWESFPDPTKFLQIFQDPRFHANPSQIQPKFSKSFKSYLKSTDPWKSFLGPTKIFKIMQNSRIHGNPLRSNP